LSLRHRVTGRLKLRGDVGRIDIHPSFRCDGDLWIGVHSAQGRITIAAGVSASGPLVVTAVRHLTIGAGTLCGPNVLITDHYHGNTHDAAHRDMVPSARPLHSPGEIVICDNVQLGANVVVLAPAHIGQGAIIAANAVVKGTIAAMAIHKGLASARERHNVAPAFEPGE
jgi:acetyltransferase-like isoleucine patch superfamily enzyme